MIYKLRSECLNDIQKVIDALSIQLESAKITIDSKTYINCEFEFKTKLDLEEIISRLKSIKNSHVMYQTVQPIEEYTGERNDDIPEQASPKEKIEEQLLIAMDAMDEMKHLTLQLPEEEGYQDCFMSNLIDIKSRLKQFLNNDFDRLARQRKERIEA